MEEARMEVADDRALDKVNNSWAEDVDRASSFPCSQVPVTDRIACLGTYYSRKTGSPTLPLIRRARKPTTEMKQNSLDKLDRRILDSIKKQFGFVTADLNAFLKRNAPVAVPVDRVSSLTDVEIKWLSDLREQYNASPKNSDRVRSICFLSYGTCAHRVCVSRRSFCLLP